MLRSRNLRILGLGVCISAFAGCAFQAPGPVQCGISGGSPKAAMIETTRNPCQAPCVDSLRQRLADLERRIGDVAKTADQANNTAEKALKCCRKDYTVLLTKEINFDFNKFDLRPDARATLDTVAMKLQSDPDLIAEMGGYCDGVGSTDYNIVLGQKRADAARMYLVSQHKINLGRLAIRTFGKDAPIASNDSDTGRARNRRVSIDILGYAQ